MTVRKVSQLQERISQVLTAPPWHLIVLADRISILQWLSVGIVGAALGIYTLTVTSLPLSWLPFFILAAIFPFLVMIIGNVRRVLLAIVLLDIPLQLDIYLGYRTEVSDLGALSGWSISVTTLSLGLLYILWLAKVLAKVEPQPRPLIRMSLPLTLYLAFVALSVVVASDVTLTLFEIFLLSQIFLLHVYVASSVRTRSDVLFIVTMLLIGVILESLIMIGLRYAGQDLRIEGISSLTWDDTGATGQPTRSGGTVGSPNAAASYFSLLLTPAISLLLTPIGRWYKRLAILAFGLGGMALMLTFSRGGLTAFILSLTILCLLAWYRGWLPSTVPMAVAVGVGLLSLLFQDDIMARLAENNPIHARATLNKLAFWIINDYPLFGIGANNFAVVMKQYLTPEFGGEWLYIVHNKYLLVWAETGMGGLVAFIGFLVATIYQGWQCWRFNDRFLSPLALGFIAAIIGHMVHMFIDSFNSRPLVQLLWLIVGLITAMYHLNDPLIISANRMPRATKLVYNDYQ